MRKSGCLSSIIKLILSFCLLYGISTITSSWNDDRSATDAAATAEEQLAARLPSIPEELRNNIFLNTRSSGTCESLTGDVMLTIVFVDDAESSWTTEEIDAVKEQQLDATALLQEQAAAYNASLNLSIQYLHATANAAYDRDASSPWVESALADLGFANLSVVNFDLEADYNVKEAPLLFYIHREGRSFAQSQSTILSAEYTILYQDLVDYRHELYHLFGAKDFYYPAEVSSLADQYLPNSLMKNSYSGDVDELTAYLIGWTDEISNNALAFLQATNHLTEEDLEAAHDHETFTGYGTKTYDDGSTYVGDLVDGLPHGIGTFTWANGNIYEGEWMAGQIHGAGTFTFADGTVWTGSWENGEFIG